MSNKALYEYGRYEVRVCDDVEDGTQTRLGYGVFNKETGVREYSDVAMHTCVTMCRHWELLLREALSKKDVPGDGLWITTDEDDSPKGPGLKPLN